MKILAFDSSGLVASVAIVENNNLIAELQEDTFPDTASYAGRDREDDRDGQREF